MFKKLSFAISVILLQSCSLLEIGESEYSCPGKAKGVVCKTSRTVYEMTNNGQNIFNDSEIEMSNEKTEQVSNKNVSTDIEPSIDGWTADRRAEVIDDYLPRNYVPIRSENKILRIWIAPWEDKDGDLNVTGYIYTEIEPRKWVLTDHVYNYESKVIKPLN